MTTQTVLMMTATGAEQGPVNLVFTKVRSPVNGYWKYMVASTDKKTMGRALELLRSVAQPKGATVFLLTRLSMELANRTLDLMRPIDEERLDHHLRTGFAPVLG